MNNQLQNKLLGVLELGLKNKPKLIKSKRSNKVINIQFASDSQAALITSYRKLNTSPRLQGDNRKRARTKVVKL